MNNISTNSYSNYITPHKSTSGQLDQKSNFSNVLENIEQPNPTDKPQLNDAVTISDQAKHAAAKELPGWAQEAIDSLRNNPNQKEAMDNVKLWATTSEKGTGGALHSVPDKMGGTSYYYETGLPVTKESEARFNALAQSITEETTRIFNSESAKGSSAADIFEKMQQYMATQPDDYLQALDWHRSILARK